MKKSPLIVFLLFLSLSSAHATLFVIGDFSGSETVIDFDEILPGEAITDQYAALGVTFPSSPPDQFRGAPLGTTINGTMSGANFSPINNPIVAEFSTLQNKVGMYFGTIAGEEHTVQIQAFLGDSPSPLESQTFLNSGNDILDGGNLAAVFGGIFLDGGVFDRIEFSGISDPKAFQIDDFRFERSVNPIPEPATILLLGSGLVGIAGFGRKKFFRK